MVDKVPKQTDYLMHEREPRQKAFSIDNNMLGGKSTQEAFE